MVQALDGLKKLRERAPKVRVDGNELVVLDRRFPVVLGEGERPGHGEVPLHHGDRSRGIARGRPVAGARLRAELGNVLLVIVDHVPTDLTTKSAAVEVAQKDKLTPRLWRQR